MHHHTVLAYFILIVFGLTLVIAQANKEREQFADLLHKRKHLNGYWVGKRYIAASDEDMFGSGSSSNTSSFRPQ
jgi:hypothetical protein